MDEPSCERCGHPADAHRTWISRPHNRDTMEETRCQVQITVTRDSGSDSWQCTCHTGVLV